MTKYYTWDSVRHTPSVWKYSSKKCIKMNISRTKIRLDTFIPSTSISGRREYVSMCVCQWQSVRWTVLAGLCYCSSQVPNQLNVSVSETDLSEQLAHIVSIKKKVVPIQQHARDRRQQRCIQTTDRRWIQRLAFSFVSWHQLPMQTDTAWPAPYNWHKSTR